MQVLRPYGFIIYKYYVIVSVYMATKNLCPHFYLNLGTLAGKVFTHKCDTGNLSALIQC